MWPTTSSSSTATRIIRQRAGVSQRSFHAGSVLRSSADDSAVGTDNFGLRAGLDRFAVDGDLRTRRMPEPLPPAVAVHLLHLGDDVRHGPALAHPSAVDVWEIDGAVRTLLAVV